MKITKRREQETHWLVLATTSNRYWGFNTETAANKHAETIAQEEGEEGVIVYRATRAVAKKTIEETIVTDFGPVKSGYNPPHNPKRDRVPQKKTAGWKKERRDSNVLDATALFATPMDRMTGNNPEKK